MTAFLLASAAVGQPPPTTQPAARKGAATKRPRGPIILATKGSQLRATIQTDEVSAEEVVVSVGTSMVLDMNLPVSRVEVARPEVAEVTVLSPRQLLIAGYAVGTTQVILWGDEDERLVIAVQVEPDLAQLRAAIKRTAPDAEIEVRAVMDTVILTGQVPNVDDADRIVELAKIVFPKTQNQMTVAGEQQVLLRCTVAEVSKSALRQLGVDGWVDVQDDYAKIASNQVAGINPALMVPGQTAVLSRGVTFGTDLEQGFFQITPGFSNLRMELFVRVMQENGLMRILAEPNLVALSGEKAEFLAGGEFPVPVPQAAGGGVTITIEWKDYGVKLEFVPTVIGQQMIRLSVAPEVSEIDYTNALRLEGYLVPGVTQRRALTTIELGSGSTIAIAGLLREQLRGSLRKLPGLGDVPVLGSLFRSVRYQRDLTELVILVTPELVSGMYPDQVATVPGQHLKTPSDWELYGLGMLEGEPIPEDRSRQAALLTEIEPHYRKFASPPEQMSLHGPWGPAEASETE